MKNHRDMVHPDSSCEEATMGGQRPSVREQLLGTSHWG